MRRIDNLTGLRCFAALWVILYHVQSLDVCARYMPVPLVESGYLGVDIFFVLSGFILSLVYLPKLPQRFNRAWFARFLTRRFAKVYPLHLLTLLAAGVLTLVSRHSGVAVQHSFSDNTLWTALCSALMIHAWGTTPGLSWNLPSWSVSAEWFAYLLLFVPMAYTLRRVRTRWIVALAAALWMTLMAYVQWRRGGLLDIVTTNGVVRITAEFFCGYALFRLVRNRHVQHGDRWTLGGLALMALVCVFPVTPWMLTPAMPAILMLLTGLYAGGRFADRIFGNKACVFIGNASYSIYMVQYFVQIAANQITRRLHHAPTLGFSVAVALVDTAVAVAVGCACYWFFEEPVRERLVVWLDRLGQRRPDDAVALAA